MNANGLSLLLFPCLCSVLCFQNHVRSEALSEESTLQGLFEHALTAEGAAYARLRAEVLAREGAVPFLERKCHSNNLHSRVLARAMLSWAREPEINVRREELVVEVLSIARRMRPGMLVGVQGLAFGFLAGREGRVQPEDELRQDAAVPFLLGLALKGLDPKELGEWEKRANFAFWARCYAAALVGGYKGPDVIPVLTGIVQSSDSYAMRACGATGLTRTESFNAVGPLIQALSDSSEWVREPAYAGLMNITGQDFRSGNKPWVDGKDIGQEQRRKFEEWWRRNRADAETLGEDRTLEGLFKTALTAEGAAHARLRAELLAREGAVPFLEDKCKSEDLHSRVLAGAMLSWAKDPDVNQRRKTLVVETLAAPGRLYGYWDAFALVEASGKRSVQPEDELRQDAAVPFLQELALKGFDPDELRREGKMENFASWARCYAAGLVGEYEGPDVIPLLLELLRSSNSLPMRVCAVTGLGRSGSLDVVEPLIEALSDPWNEVRVSAYKGLMEITGQDFRSEKKSRVLTSRIGEEERRKFEDWWDQNKEQLLKNK